MNRSFFSSCGLIVSAGFLSLLHGGQTSPVESLLSDSIYLSGGFEATAGVDAVPLVLDRKTLADLAKLAGVEEFQATIIPRTPPADLKTLPLAVLLEAFPLAEGFDGLVLETYNGWESFLTVDYLKENRSQLLLYYNGLSPSDGAWPYFGGDIEPLAPFYVFDPEDPIPAFTDAPPFGMIAATQIKGIRAVNTEDRYASFYASALDQAGQEGRQLFMQRCNGCHMGPGNVGGDVALRPFPVLQAHARYNSDYFKKVVVNPDQFYPGTAMPEHADFGDAELEALIAFLSQTELP